MLTHRACNIIVAAIVFWALLNIIAQFTLMFASIEYDSRGAASLVWWAAQLLALPVLAVSELLSAFGARVSGLVGYSLTTIALSLVLIVAVRFARFKSDDSI
jgi:hypothetical protein